MSTAKVQTIELPRDGIAVPWLAFGTGTALRTNENVADIAKLAIAQGFRHLDGAQAYKNEDALGNAIATSGVPRSELFVTTKLSALAEGESVEASLRGSLARLKLDHVDLFLLHDPQQHSSTPGRLKAVWKEIVAAKKKGLAKSVGVSNFNVKLLNEIIADDTEVPSVNQIEFHPWVYQQLEPLLAYHAQHGIVTASYGGLTPILPTRAGKDASLADAQTRLVEALDKIAAARAEEAGYAVSQNQVLLKWLQQLGVIAVTTSTKESRLKEYVATEALPALTETEAWELQAAIEGVHYRSFMFFKYMEDQEP